MRCFQPITLKNKKHGSNENVHVPCGKCAACLAREKLSWQTRLELQNRYSTNAKFVTLTYADEFLYYGEKVLPDGEILLNQPVLNKVHIQNFFKRFRELNKSKIKYYLVGEYGENTDRPHYHMLLFNADSRGEKLKLDILKSWGKGTVDIGTVTSASIAYTLSYMNKNKDFRNAQTFRLMSKGLGLEYANRNKNWHQESLHRNYILKENGIKVPIPRYLKKKMYNDHSIAIQAKLTESQLKEKNESDEKRFKKLNPRYNIYLNTLDKQEALIKKQTKKIIKNGF